MQHINLQDVINDTELQDWIHEIVTEGIAWEDENNRGFPTSFCTIKSLVCFLLITYLTFSKKVIFMLLFIKGGL